MKAKLAHLFLIRDGLNHGPLWKRFFRGRKGLYEVYVHAKSPSQLKSDWLRGNLISDYCDTQWGSVSLVKAELLLLKAALQDTSNRFFVLHSESCIPIRRFDFVYNKIV